LLNGVAGEASLRPAFVLTNKDRKEKGM